MADVIVFPTSANVSPAVACAAVKDVDDTRHVIVALEHEIADLQCVVAYQAVKLQRLDRPDQLVRRLRLNAVFLAVLSVGLMAIVPCPLYAAKESIPVTCDPVMRV